MSDTKITINLNLIDKAEKTTSNIKEDIELYDITRDALARISRSLLSITGQGDIQNPLHNFSDKKDCSKEFPEAEYEAKLREGSYTEKKNAAQQLQLHRSSLDILLTANQLKKPNVGKPIKTYSPSTVEYLLYHAEVLANTVLELQKVQQVLK